MSEANVSNASRLTLREQQVFQLRREIMHPGGIRLQLRRKDCLGSIALVDAYNAIWFVLYINYVIKKVKKNLFFSFITAYLIKM